MPILSFTKIGGSATTLTLLIHYEMSKVGKNSLPNQEFLRDSQDISKGLQKVYFLFLHLFVVGRVMAYMVIIQISRLAESTA
jgi:hypothetical protein